MKLTRISAALLLGWLLAGSQAAEPNRPNVLFIMADDHAAQAISAYGSRVNQTPNIDRIAKEGIRFNDCFCVNSLCSPSRATILTGKYSQHNGVLDNASHSVFDGRQLTLPKVLRNAGYQTAIIGKWHLQSTPTGFDYYDILPGQGQYHNPVMIENGKQRKLNGYVTDLITDQALDWIEKQRTYGKPFFLMLHHKAPHANWEPDQKHMSLYQDSNIPEPATFNDDYQTRTAQIRDSKLKVGMYQWKLHQLGRYGTLPKGKSAQATREYIYQVYMKNYLRCIASVDDNVGRVLDYLTRTGLDQNTIVVYTSDQGFFLGEHGLYDKRFMYEESLRMPLLIRYPSHIKPGTTSDAMVSNIDFAPTLLAYAGVPVPKEMQGESFMEIADTGRTPKEWRQAFYYRFYEEAYGIGPHEGIRTSRYKLIHFLYGDHGWELYDLEKDPRELRNVYADPEHRNMVMELKTKLKQLRTKFQIKDPDSASPPARPGRKHGGTR